MGLDFYLFHALIPSFSFSYTYTTLAYLNAGSPLLFFSSPPQWSMALRIQNKNQPSILEYSFYITKSAVTSISTQTGGSCSTAPVFYLSSCLRNLLCVRLNQWQKPRLPQRTEAQPQALQTNKFNQEADKTSEGLDAKTAQDILDGLCPFTGRRQGCSYINI